MRMRLWKRLAFLLRRGRFDRELTEELEFHREMIENDKAHEGLDRERAALAARRQLGNTVVAREDSTVPWALGRSDRPLPASTPWYTALVTDLRDAFRNLLVARGTTALALVVLTLGITAGTVTFSVVDTVALRQLPFQSPGQLVAIARVTEVSPEPGLTTTQDYFAWRNNVPALLSLTAVRMGAELPAPDRRRNGQPSRAARDGKFLRRSRRPSDAWPDVRPRARTRGQRRRHRFELRHLGESVRQ